MFFHVPFNLELISTNVTDMTSYKCKRYLKHINVKSLENIFYRKHRIAKNIQTKHKHIFVPSQRYQDSRHLLQNPKVPKNEGELNDLK